MKFHRIHSFLIRGLLLLAGFFQGCTFEPEGEFIKPVKEVIPLAFIDLTEYNEQDTIVLIQPSTFKYVVAIAEPSALEKLQILLDSTEVFSNSATAGEFTLSQAFISPGIHQLTIRFIAKSNSGSFADKIGAEHFQVWKTWVLKVIRFDNDPPAALELKISEKDGLLRLDWTPYSKANFISYKLKVVHPYQREIVFDDRESTFWVDSSFLWGSASYEVTVTNPFGSTTTAVGINEEQKFTVTYNAKDSSAVLNWKASRFSKAFDKAVISENNTQRQTITLASDSTLTMKLNEVLWGRGESVMLQLFPKDKDRAKFESRVYIYDLVPVTLLRGRPKLSYQNGIQKVVGYSQHNSLFYFYDAQLKVTDSSTVYTSAFAVPYSGKYVFYVNNNAIVRWNLVTNERNYSNEYPGFIIEPMSLHGSANGFASYFSFNSQNSWDGRLSQAVQNTDDKTFLERIEVSYDPKINIPPRNRILSDDGRFLYNVYAQSVHKVENGIPIVGYLPQTGAFYCFRNDNTDEILLTGLGSLSIISSHDMSLLRTISIPSGYSVVSYDAVTHHVVCAAQDANLVYLINIDNNFTKTVQAYSSEWKLVNGYLINYAGQYMKVL